jgi:hypothetical protein
MINVSVSGKEVIPGQSKIRETRGKRKGSTGKIRTVNGGWEEKGGKIHSPVANREIIGSREGEYLHKHVTREGGGEM